MAVTLGHNALQTGFGLEAEGGVPEVAVLVCREVCSAAPCREAQVSVTSPAQSTAEGITFLSALLSALRSVVDRGD